MKNDHYKTFFEERVIMKLLYRHPPRFEGRQEVIHRSNSPLKYLSYARIVLTSAAREVSVFSPERETVIMCVRGRSLARVGPNVHEMGFQDGLYIPRGCECSIESSERAELVEGSAPSEIDRDPVFSPFSEIERDPVRHRAKGDPHEGTFRDSYVHFGPEFEASRILFGFARIRPGNWSSWPPHEHRSALEEIYIYYDMPWPAFGIQLVYDDIENPAFCGVVREGDAVIVSEGYHPCISAPQYPANYVWVLAGRNKAERASAPTVDPDFG
jgi:5-deoxy-glucuronate isomerase